MDYYAASKLAGQANRYPNFDPATDCRMPDDHEPFEYIDLCNAYGQTWFIRCETHEIDGEIGVTCTLECLDLILAPPELEEPEPGEIAMMRWNTGEALPDAAVIAPPEHRETMPFVESLPTADRLIELSIGAFYSYQAMEMSALAVFAIVAVGQRWGWWR